MAKLFGKKEAEKVEKENQVVSSLLIAIERGVFSVDIPQKFTLQQDRAIKEIALELCKELDIEPTLDGLKKAFPERPILVKKFNELLKIKTPKVG